MTGRLIVVGGVTVTIGLILAGAPTNAASCPASRADAAAAAVDHLLSWPEVFSFYKDYAICDDGGIADGATESVVRLLASRWDDLETLAAIIGHHTDFRSFVLRHVDSTADTKDLERVSQQSLRNCPPGLHPLCKDIAAAAKEALQ